MKRDTSAFIFVLLRFTHLHIQCSAGDATAQKQCTESACLHAMSPSGERPQNSDVMIGLSTRLSRCLLRKLINAKSILNKKNI